MAVATTYPITLNQNLIFKSISNMIISQEVFADNIASKENGLLNRFRKAVGLYGDQLVYYSTDVLAVRDWLNDAEAANLLNLYRPESPKVQTITINQYKKINLTIDDYLTKQAWMGQNAFSKFNSVMTAWVSTTKDILESTMMDVFIGTHETTEAEQIQTITLPAEPAATASEADIEAYNRLTAQTIATKAADILTKLQYPNRNNDYGHMRRFNASDFILVWNSDWYNKITHMDTPTIFHRDSALIKGLEEEIRPGYIFGTPNTAAGTAPASNSSIYYTVPVTVEATGTPGTDAYVPAHTYFPGELVPGGTAYAANTTATINPNIPFKIVHKDGVVLADAFGTMQEVFNQASLTTTFWNIFGYAPITQLHDKPFITVKVAYAKAPAA